MPNLKSLERERNISNPWNLMGEWEFGKATNYCILQKKKEKKDARFLTECLHSIHEHYIKFLFENPIATRRTLNILELPQDSLPQTGGVTHQRITKMWPALKRFLSFTFPLIDNIKRIPIVYPCHC